MNKLASWVCGNILSTSKQNIAWSHQPRSSHRSLRETVHLNVAGTKPSNLAVDRLRVGWLNGWEEYHESRRCSQDTYRTKMLKGNLPRVMYQQVYKYTNNIRVRKTPFAAKCFVRPHRLR